MRDLITFYLTVKYRAPSKENLFLDRGWGIRNVSGPCLNRPEGFIIIDSTVLSSKVPSTISLIFSISNRCPTSSVLARVSTRIGEFSYYIRKNGSKEFTIGPAYSDSQQKFSIAVCLPDTKNLPDLGAFADILAIDELTIERQR